MPSRSSNPPLRLPRVAGRLAALAAILAVSQASAVRAQPADWPRNFASSSGTFTIYQPQPEDLIGDELTARAAFSLQKDAQSEPTFGVLWFTERIVIDRDSSSVTARDLDVTKVRLPGITPTEAHRYEKLVESEAMNWDLSGSLEELQAGLASTEKERASVEGLNNDPPKIIFSHHRAILVVYDGPPELLPIDNSKLEGVGNTPYAVLYDPATRIYYLSGANLWYRSDDPLGPWAVTEHPPAAVVALVPPDTAAADQITGIAPEVLTATEPTELVSMDGPPQYAPLVDDELLYVTNTESDVIREVNTQQLYVLLSGRWYRASSEAGPWTYVRGDSLPESFSRVPPDSPKGHILASVAGTEEADDAVADAEIPQTSAIRRDASGFQVVYDGPPQFEPIEGTDMLYAVNTDAEVIFADGRYYACDQGVWYVADDPEGPWKVSDTRPIEVDDIPPSCPVYDVRYVYVYDWTPDVVYVGYLPGYFGCYPYYGTVVYGTGYHYKPWRGHHHFCPRRLTWGLHPRYNPWLSRWSFGFSYGSGFLRIGWHWHSRHGPARHRERPLWYGPGGFRRPLVAADRTLLRVRPPSRWRTRLSDRTPLNLYHRSSNAARIDPKAGRVPPRRVGRPLARPSTLPNDVYAGRDGKVYRREPSGTWKVNVGRTWKPTRLPTRTPAAPTPARNVRPKTRPLPPSAAPAVPAKKPSEPQVKRPARQPKPLPPGPSPGDLERAYRARQRAAPEPSPSPPAPAPSPPPPAIQPKKPAAQQQHPAPPPREERPRQSRPVHKP